MKTKNVVYLLVLNLALAFSCSNESIPEASVTLEGGSRLMFEKRRMTDGTTYVTTEFQYNALGQLTSRVSYNQTGVVSNKQEYFYDNNQLVRTAGMSDVSSSTTATNYFYFSSTYVYDQGLLVRENSFSKHGAEYEQRSYTVYEYNESALPVKQSVFSITGELAYFKTYAYDNAGNVLELKEYDVIHKSGLTLETTFEHDSRKNPLKTIYAAVELLPYSINTNNITKSISINHVYPSTPSGDVARSETRYKQYNSDGYPVLFSENDRPDIIYEYQ